MSLSSLVEKATANSDDPTPGYVYTELVKLTHADVMNCDKLADALFKKLSSDKAAVKWKTLLVMKNVAKSGRMEFRRSLQRHNEQVKACLSFKGPPDPLKGDEPYRKVRDAAKDALEAMFDNNAPAGGAGQLSGRITGMGGGLPPAEGAKYPPTSGSAPRPMAPGGGGFNTALPGQPGYDPNSPLHAPPSSSGTMQSLSNYDPNKDKGLTTAIFDKMKSAFTTSTTPPASHGSVGTYRPSGSSGGSSSGAHGGASAYPPASGGSASTAGGWAPGGATSFGAPDPNRRPGQPGGGWGAPAPAPAAAGSSALGPGGRRGRMPGGGVPELGRVGGAAVGGEYERGMVNDLCSPGGIKAGQPDKDKLASFLQAVRTLDVKVVHALLAEKVAGARESAGDASAISSAAKAIAVIDAITSAPGCEAAKKHLADNCDVLLDVMEAVEVKGTVRQAAYKCLKALGVEGVELPEDMQAQQTATSTPVAYQAYESPAPAPVPAPAPAQSDLFGGLSFGAPAPAQVPAPAPAVAPADIFGGLAMGHAPAPAPAPPVTGLSDMFGGLSMGAPAPVQSQQAPVGDIFGGLAMGMGGAAAAPVAPAAPAAAPTPAPFAGMGMQVAPTPAPAPAASMAGMGMGMPMAGQAGMAPMGMGMGMGMAQAGNPAASQQLMMLQQQISTLTMQMASNPAASAMIMPQLMALQQQQTALMMNMAGQGKPMGMPMQAMGMSAAMQPMGMGMGGMGMGMGMQAAPAMGMGMGMTQAAAAPAPAAAPARPADAFAFASADLFGSK